MVFLHIPTQHPGWGFFLLPAEPSLLSTTRRSLRRHTRARTRRARSSIMAPTSSRALIVGDPYVHDLHQLGWDSWLLCGDIARQSQLPCMSLPVRGFWRHVACSASTPRRSSGGGNHD
jgi:hypothetical protein